MTTKDLLVYNRRYRQTIETVGERLPEFDVVTTFAFVVEAVDAVDGGALMIASEQEKVLGEFDLVGEEETNGLE